MKGKIFIIGIGPGSAEHLTQRARTALYESDVIVGYKTYVNLIKCIAGGKEILSTGMTEEVDRCRAAIELAEKGKKVAVISSGDAGIYGMAGLIYELVSSQQSAVSSHPLHQGEGRGEGGVRVHDIEVIPGVSALNAAAAVLGAPLMHDFAAISLSDLLTPWELIQKRIEAAAMTDFVICIYNPKSSGRTEQIGIARDIILRHRKPDTPVGIVKNAMREGQKAVVTTLADMLNHDIDMLTTVIVGNSATYVADGVMVTPRGYNINPI
ncbi:MAG: precorrin-3B C(17)-methyltransferase [Deltaproteobacteria bacterium]|nr:precorrin-3B C(17)-methyltransferase [Deltaproteobacteria bacterium]